MGYETKIREFRFFTRLSKLRVIKSRSLWCMFRGFPRLRMGPLIGRRLKQSMERSKESTLKAPEQNKMSEVRGQKAEIRRHRSEESEFGIRIAE